MPKDIKEEFIAKFVEPIKTEMRGMNLNNEACVMGTEKEVWAWMGEKLKKAYTLGKEASHETEDGFCCACSYDILVMKEKIEQAYQRGVNETIRSLKVERLGYDNEGGNKLFMEGYNQAITRQEIKAKKLC